MNLTNERPLSEIYREDVHRLCARELDLIARHRVLFEQARLAEDAERLNPIKEIEL
jgi:hypothetical protein